MIQSDLIVTEVGGVWEFVIETDEIPDDVHTQVMGTVTSSGHSPDEFGDILGEGAVVGNVECEVDGSEYTVQWDAEVLNEVYW